jgi:hypothetical protein
MTWFGPTRWMMTRTLCGIKRGLLRKSLPMPRPALPPAD